MTTTDNEIDKEILKQHWQAYIDGLQATGVPPTKILAHIMSVLTQILKETKKVDPTYVKSVKDIFNRLIDEV